MGKEGKGEALRNDILKVWAFSLQGDAANARHDVKRSLTAGQVPGLLARWMPWGLSCGSVLHLDKQAVFCSSTLLHPIRFPPLPKPHPHLSIREKLVLDNSSGQGLPHQKQ